MKTKIFLTISNIIVLICFGYAASKGEVAKCIFFGVMFWFFRCAVKDVE